MKKSWLHGLAISLGLVGYSTVCGQYPNNYQNNFGPSSYPVQTQQPMASVLQGLPQVPANYQPAYSQPVQQPGPYQLVNVGDPQAIFSQPAQNVAPQPVPPVQQQYSPAPALVGQPGCNTCAPTPNLEYVQQPQEAPQLGYNSYQQSLAPNCTSCGPAPVSGGTGGFGNFGGGNLVGHGNAFGFGNAGFGGHRLSGGLPMGAKPWFFGGGALIFNRVDSRDVPLSFVDTDYAGDILTTRSARMPVSAGFEAMMGRYFNCGRNAIQATYWGVFPEEQTELRSRTMAGDYRSRLPLTYVQISGTPAIPATPYDVYDWYDNAFAHQVTRSSSYHNVEVNLLGFAMGGAARNFNLATAGTMFSGLGHGRGNAGCGYCGGAGCGACAATCSPSQFATSPCGLTAPACGSRLNMTWIAGFRYFHFADNLFYAASLGDGMIDRSADDLYYEVNTTNDLFGGQFGSRADYCIGQRINAYASAKVGVYNNQSNLQSFIGTDFEDAYLNDTRLPTNPNNGQVYRFDETKNEVAFLSELGTGLGFRISPKWTATAGYRAVIASGVATSTDNVRSTFANYEEIRDFDNRDTLILHGVNIGALYNF